MTTNRLGNTSFPTGIGRGCVRQNNAGFWSVASKVTAGSYSRPVRTTTVCVVGVNRWGRNEVRTMSAHGLNRGHGPMVKRFSESQIHEEVMGASAPTASEVEAMYEYANPDNWYRSFDIREDEEPVAVCDDCGDLYEEDYDEGHCRCKLCGKSAIETEEA